MRILLVNVDSRWNMAIRKMYNYFRQDHDVKMIDLGLSGYPHNRHKEIDGSDYEKFYIDYASYCNQPAYFKKVSFEEYLHIRHDYRYKTPNLARIEFSLRIYRENGGK